MLIIYDFHLKGNPHENHMWLKCLCVWNRNQHYVNPESFLVTHYKAFARTPRIQQGRQGIQ